MDNKRRPRKRRVCENCGENYSKSAYYRHISECYDPRKDSDSESDSSSNSSFAITASDLSNHELDDFKLNSDEDLDVTATVSGNHRDATVSLPRATDKRSASLFDESTFSDSDFELEEHENKSSPQFEHLMQMKWRLREGRGEAIYEIGVADNGLLLGLSENDLTSSLNTLKRMAKRLGANVNILQKKEVSTEPQKRFVVETCVRKVPDDQLFLDLRLAVLGNVDSGKSTLLGVLIQGELDDGRGRARLNLFHHLYETESDGTSTTSYAILGFSSDGKVVNYAVCGSTEEICTSCSKLITFISLTGHEECVKTTVFGVTSHYPDAAMLVISATNGVADTTKEHFSFTVALGMRTFVVITKIDMCQEHTTQRVVEQVKNLLHSYKKVPTVVKDDEEVLTAAQNFLNNRIVPIFIVSSLTGDNLEQLQSFLNNIPLTRLSPEQEDKTHQQLPEFQVDEIYSVPDTGTVVGGILTSGTLQEGDHVKVGPIDTDKEDKFINTIVSSIHRSRTPCRVLKAGQAATLALENVEKSHLRKGMVVLDQKHQLNDQVNICNGFEADMYVVCHDGTNIKKEQQGTIYVSSTMQTAVIKDIKGTESLCQGDRGIVEFKLLKHLEFLRVGSKVLFNKGRTKATGQIKKLSLTNS